MENYRIDKASKDDVPVLVKLVNSAYRGESSKGGWTTEAELLDGIRIDEGGMFELFEDKDATILKYLDEKDIIRGCVYLLKKAEKMYLGMLTVSPEIQVRGIGKKFMTAAEELAISNGIKVIEMTVITVRDELVSWYERRGYHKTGETKPFPDDPRFGIPKQPLEFFVLQKRL